MTPEVLAKIAPSLFYAYIENLKKPFKYRSGRACNDPDFLERKMNIQKNTRITYLDRNIQPTDPRIRVHTDQSIYHNVSPFYSALGMVHILCL